MASGRPRLDAAEFVGSSPDASALNDVRKAIVGMYEIFKKGTELVFRDAEGEFSITVTRQRLQKRNKVLQILFDFYEEKLNVGKEGAPYRFDVLFQDPFDLQYFEDAEVGEFIEGSKNWPRIGLKGSKPELWDRFLGINKDFAKFWVNPTVSFSEFEKPDDVDDEIFQNYLIETKLLFFTIAAVVARSRSDIAEMTAQVPPVLFDESLEVEGPRDETSESGTFYAASLYPVRALDPSTTVTFTALDDDGTLGGGASPVLESGVDPADTFFGDFEGGAFEDPKEGLLGQIGMDVDPAAETDVQDGIEEDASASFFGSADEFMIDPAVQDPSNRGRKTGLKGVFAKWFGGEVNQKGTRPMEVVQGGDTK